MKSVVYFCLFFWMAPLFLAWMMKLREVMSGPESDEPYDLEQYHIKLRRGAIELGVFTLMMLAGAALALYANANIAE